MSASVFAPRQSVHRGRGELFVAHQAGSKSLSCRNRHCAGPAAILGRLVLRVAIRAKGRYLRACQADLRRFLPRRDRRRCTWASDQTNAALAAVSLVQHSLQSARQLLMSAGETRNSTHSTQLFEGLLGEAGASPALPDGLLVLEGRAKNSRSFFQGCIWEQSHTAIDDTRLYFPSEIGKSFHRVTVCVDIGSNKQQDPKRRGSIMVRTRFQLDAGYLGEKLDPGHDLASFVEVGQSFMRDFHS